MDRVVFESVRKVFRHRPALFNWLGKERGGETVALKQISFSAGTEKSGPARPERQRQDHSAQTGLDHAASRRRLCVRCWIQYAA